MCNNGCTVASCVDMVTGDQITSQMLPGLDRMAQFNQRT